MAEVGRRAPRPIVANMIEHGKTPVLPREQLVELGFQLILYPLSGVFAAARALYERAGFTPAEPFADYVRTEDNTFYTLTLE